MPASVPPGKPANDPGSAASSAKVHDATVSPPDDDPVWSKPITRAKADESSAAMDDSLAAQRPEARGPAARSLPRKRGGRNRLGYLVGLGGVAALVWYGWPALQRSSTPTVDDEPAAATATVSLPPLDVSRLDGQRLQAAIDSGNPEQVWDWTRTFPRSLHRAHAYGALLNLGVSETAVCDAVRGRAPDLLEDEKPMARRCGQSSAD